MLYLVISGVWFIVTAAVAAVMYASQVGPDQAVSNLSLWAKKFGVENPPEWLKEKSADRRIRRSAAIGLAALLTIGGFMAGMVFQDYTHPVTRQDATKYPTNRWEPLTADEALALRSELRKLPAEKLSVLCAYAGCADLADSIFTVARGLNWTGNFEGSYLTDGGIKPGIEIWSFPEKVDARNKIAVAIERATNGRLKVSSYQWDRAPTTIPTVANNINLVIGRAR